VNQEEDDRQRQQNVNSTGHDVEGDPGDQPARQEQEKQKQEQEASQHKHLRVRLCIPFSKSNSGIAFSIV
jgi:hypothetical protein